MRKRRPTTIYYVIPLFNFFKFGTKKIQVPSTEVMVAVFDLTTNKFKSRIKTTEPEQHMTARRAEVWGPKQFLGDKFNGFRVIHFPELMYLSEDQVHKILNVIEQADKVWGV